MGGAVPMPGKRKKDQEYYDLRNILEQFLETTERYRAKLEAELAAARAEPEPYMHLVRALEREIAIARKLETQLDEQVWPILIELANSSAYVEHARTRDYF
jgi:hypothetical protein